MNEHGSPGPPWWEETPAAEPTPRLPFASPLPEVPPPAPPPPEDRRGWLVPLIASIVGGVVGAAITVAVVDAQTPGPTPVITVPTTLAAAPVVSPGETAPNVVSAAAASVVPSIVTVVSDSGFGAATGSGVVWGDGHIVTNHHVVAGAGEEDLIVEFADGIQFPATLVGSDPLTDLAVLRVERADLSAVRLGETEDIRIGETAVAVGNPLGLAGGPSVTAGVISAVDRTLRVEVERILYGLLQTDAPITRGSSGGALVNRNGELIGITTAIGVSDVGAEGLGFAIPVDLAVTVVEDLVADGLVRHAFLGITGTTATRTTEDGASFPVGAAISDFAEVSALREAGAEVGDVVVALEGAPVRTLDELIALLRRRRAGDQVTVTVLRDDRQLELAVTLGEYPDAR